MFDLISPDASRQTESPPDDDNLHPPTDDADNLPTSLAESVREAIDTVGEGVRGNSFEPLSFNSPAGWTRTECCIGGNRDADGHFERVEWSHPFYSDITVESERGEDQFRAWAADYDPFYTGSRHVTFVRAAQHIAECDEPPKLAVRGERLTKTAERAISVTKEAEHCKPLIDAWVESYPKASLKDAIQHNLRRCGHHYAAGELDEYVDTVAREWDAEVGD